MAPSPVCGALRGACWLLLFPVLAFGQPSIPDSTRDKAPDSTRIAAIRESAVAYEHGDGVARDGRQAAALYCQAARLGDAASQFDLGWMYANGRGVARDDALAAFFFRLAAEQGIAQAATMAHMTGEPVAQPPPCMRAPAVEPATASAFVPREPTAKIRALGPVGDVVKKVALEYRVPLPLVWAIIDAESNFNPGAVSPKNAQGLMQLIPETAQRFRVRNAFDPGQNVRGGIAYLRWLLAYFEGDVSLVAAAYNAGERTVERYRGVPPYLETRAYVRRIVSVVGSGRQPFDANVVEPSESLRQTRERRSAD
jgi:soluble lytic murein transglycosylase-like protein